MDASRTTIGARLVQAIFAGMLAVVTLALYPLVAFIIGASGGAVEPSIWVGKVVFSKLGVALIFLVMLAGFFLSPARLADVFSFFWGTHPFWPKADEWVQENMKPGWVAVVLMVIAVIFIWWQLY